MAGPGIPRCDARIYATSTSLEVKIQNVYQ